MREFVGVEDVLVDATGPSLMRRRDGNGMCLGLGGLAWAQQLFDNSVEGGRGCCSATTISFSMAR